MKELFFGIPVEIIPNIKKYAIQVILREKTIFAEDLARLVSEKFGVDVSAKALGMMLTDEITKSTKIHRYRATRQGRKGMIYSLDPPIPAKICRWCRKEPAQRYSRYCYRCHQEVEKIVNFFMPIPEGFTIFGPVYIRRANFLRTLRKLRRRKLVKLKLRYYAKIPVRVGYFNR